MGTWRKSGVIKVCPECGDGMIKQVRVGGKTAKEERVFYCPNCRAAFSWDELQKNWNVNSRLFLKPEGYAAVDRDGNEVT